MIRFKSLLVISTGVLLVSLMFGIYSFNIPTYSKDSEYKNLWKQVDSFYEKNLFKSGLELIDKIYAKAKKEKNQDQLLKCVLSKTGLWSQFLENSEEKAEKEIKAFISSAKSPAKELASSALAEFYWNYYNNNKWKIDQIKTSTKELPNSFKDWKKVHFFNTCKSLYIESLKNNTNLLKEHQLNEFESSVLRQDSLLKNDLSIYEFILTRGIRFLKSDATQNIDWLALGLNKKDLLSSFENFYQLPQSKTQESKLGLLIDFYQKLYNSHQSKNKTQNIVYLDIERLSYFKSIVNINHKDSIYLNALGQLKAKYQGHPSSTEVTYKIAIHHSEKDNKLYPNHLIDSKKIAEEAINKFPESMGAKRCKQLIEQITSKNIEFRVEQVNLPNKPFKILVKFKNIKEVYANIIKLNPQDEEPRREDDLGNFLSRTPYKTKTFTLPQNKDYQEHSIELPFEPIENGKFLLVISHNPQFQNSACPIASKVFNVSNLGYVLESSKNNEQNLYIFNRTTGKPEANVLLKINYREYKGNGKPTDESIKFISNAEGMAQFTLSNQQHVNLITLSKKNDVLSTNRFYFNRYSKRSKIATSKTIFFTDRSIYRPGQILKFKGIVHSGNGKNEVILPNYPTKVYLRNTNYEIIDSLEVITNEFGSFSGSFKLPETSLNGSMSLTDNYGQKSFRLEEYKRPTFQVNFNDLNKDYKLNEKVNVDGTAKAFTGTNIARAKVSYKVVRYVNYFYRHYSRYHPHIKPVEILSGLTTTNAEGKFNIDVDLLADENLQSYSGTIQTFELSVDITDISGETQSKSIQINASEKSFTVEIEAPQEINTNKITTFKIEAQNLNNIPLSVTGNYKIFLLEKKELLKPRFWNTPDSYYLDKETFKLKFPFDAYKNEANPDSIKRIKQVLSGTLNASKSNELTIPKLKKFKPGSYLLEIEVKSSKGEKVKSQHIFTAFSEKSKTCPISSFAWSTSLQNKAQPGDIASILVGSTDTDTYAKILVENDGEIVHRESLSLSNEIKKIDIPVIEDYRGDFFVHVFVTKQNRVYNFKHHIRVPFTNKKLNFKLETFRNTLDPGSSEKWLIKFEDNDRAEVLAYMYDASLDALYKHDQKFDIFKLNRSIQRFKKDPFFNDSHARLWSIRKDYRHYPYPQIPGINWHYQSYSSPYLRFSGNGGRRTRSVMQKEIAYEEEESVPSEDWGNKKEENKSSLKFTPPKIDLRKKLGETAFFYPHLLSQNGEATISFKTPDALTKWNFVALGHTKELKTNIQTEEIVTKRNLMVVPNLPRFYREGDSVNFNCRLINSSDEILSVNSNIKLKAGELSSQSAKKVKIDPGATEIISLKFLVPENVQFARYEIKAWTDNYTDGEVGEIPILSSSKIVIETLPLNIRKQGTKEYHLKNLLASKNSNTLNNRELTLNYQTNPKLSALMALAPLTNKQNESVNNALSIYYASLIAKNELQKNDIFPRLLAIARSPEYQNKLSPLSRNQSLKNLLLAESPWSLDAKQELEGLVEMIQELDNGKIDEKMLTAEKNIIGKQLYNGAWPWFSGMRENRYITQNVLVGLGRLNKLYPNYLNGKNLLSEAIKKGLLYTDLKIKEDYDKLIKNNGPKELNNQHIGRLHVQYLYLRALFKSTPIDPKAQTAFNYYIKQAKQYWTKKSLMEEAMIAIALNSFGEKETSNEIIKSLRERSLSSEELGTYWKWANGSSYWQDAPIETQSLLIEAFVSSSQPKDEINEMTIWLLNNKQGNQWKTRNATCSAMYALNLQKEVTTRLSSYPLFMVGDVSINPNQLNFSESTPTLFLGKQLSEIGHFQKSWTAKEIEASMGKVQITKKNDDLNWGALFWKYEEDLNKIKANQSNIGISRKLFKQIVKNGKTEFEEITSETILLTGDKIVVKLTFSTDRSLEFVHLKDMRASCAEPVNNLSSVEYKQGLSFYRAINDASTEFFFEYIPKGKHVLEYEMVISQKGKYANGIATIQSIYAPSFAAHSDGSTFIIQ